MSRTFTFATAVPHNANTSRSENVFSWDTEHAASNENIIAGNASYQAFSRYLIGSDLYLLPRSRTELENVLCVPPGPYLQTPTHANLILQAEIRLRRYS